MLRTSKVILGVVVLFALFTAFSQVSSNNDVFTKSTIYCCNSGACHDMPCSAASSIRFGSNCTEYTLTCSVCMDLIPELNDSNCTYIGPWPTWCN